MKCTGLSPREIEIMQSTADGLTNEEIGKKLFISKVTVKNHKYAIYKKLGCENGNVAIAHCFRNNLIK